jgi:acyl-CoA synthetase (AMP-forming)/AMP-acid ligase II
VRFSSARAIERRWTSSGPSNKRIARCQAYIEASGVTSVTPAPAEELLAHCAASLARYKVPYEVHVRTDLPKNSVGKLVKGLLRDQVRS